MENPITATPKTKTGKFIKWIVIAAVLIIIFILLYIYFVEGKIDRKKLKQLIGEASAKYSDPVTVEKLLTQGVHEIMRTPTYMKQARTYAKQTGVPIEQVLVDNAVANAKQFKYIA